VNLTSRIILTAGLGALLACGRRVDVAPAPDTPGASVEAFLDAANAGDIERMAGLWGDERGPSNVSNVISADERVRRLQIMQRLLRSDGRRLLSTSNASPERPVLTYELRQGTRRFNVPFTCVTSRYGGWLVREIGIDAAMPSAAPRP
jgi:hypothetical protein